MYLNLIAIAKGRLYAPDSSFSRGCLFPLLALSFLSLSCLSLVEIGGRMQNPLGANDEDLPVHTLVESTCKTSRNLMNAKPPAFIDHHVAGPSPALPHNSGLAAASPRSASDGRLHKVMWADSGPSGAMVEMCALHAACSSEHQNSVQLNPPPIPPPSTCHMELDTATIPKTKAVGGAQPIEAQALPKPGTGGHMGTLEA